jgi:Holliday junction resolvase RusA-like endonuclease
MTALTIHVVGLPAPQGSKRAFVVNGHAVMTESSKKVKPWRQDVVAAVKEILAIEDWWAVPAGPVRVDITYYLPRPRYHYRTGARAHELKPNAPTWVDKKPDRDKLDRATCDALTTSGVIRDDAQIADGQTTKRYADGATGATITITPLNAVPAATSPAAGTDTTSAGALF